MTTLRTTRTNPTRDAREAHRMNRETALALVAKIQAALAATATEAPSWGAIGDLESAIGLVCAYARARDAHLITYTIAGQETGASVRAANFREDRQTRGESWDRPGRPRIDKAPTVPKTRWSLRLT